MNILINLKYLLISSVPLNSYTKVTESRLFWPKKAPEPVKREPIVSAGFLKKPEQPGSRFWGRETWHRHKSQKKKKEKLQEFVTSNPPSCLLQCWRSYLGRFECSGQTTHVPSKLLLQSDRSDVYGAHGRWTKLLDSHETDLIDALQLCRQQYRSDEPSVRTP